MRNWTKAETRENFVTFSIARIFSRKSPIINISSLNPKKKSLIKNQIGQHSSAVGPPFTPWRPLDTRTSVQSGTFSVRPSRIFLFFRLSFLCFITLAVCLGVLTCRVITSSSQHQLFQSYFYLKTKKKRVFFSKSFGGQRHHLECSFLEWRGNNNQDDYTDERIVHWAPPPPLELDWHPVVFSLTQ